MTSKLFIKRIQKEIQMYKKDNFKYPNLIIRPKENDLLTWYFIVYDLKETPFENGIYFGKIKLPTEYPLKPPDFYFITPNGRFHTEKKICTTFSSFHQDTYVSTWNIMSMMEGLISFMTDPPSDLTDGIGYISTSEQEKKQLAQKSLEWNKNNITFNEIFPDITDLLLE
jgi:ubiquitin-conjugating enzyme E2 J2